MLSGCCVIYCDWTHTDSMPPYVKKATMKDLAREGMAYEAMPEPCRQPKAQTP